MEVEMPIMYPGDTTVCTNLEEKDEAKNRNVGVESI